MSTIVETTELERQSHSLVSEALALRVTDPPSYVRAGEIRKLAKAYRLKVAEVMDPIVKATDQAHKTAVAQRKRLEAPALEVEARLGPAMVGYDQEQTRLRREAEAAAQREWDRLEAEARVLAEKEAAHLQASAEEERLQQALDAEAQGDLTLAERLIEAPLPTVAPTPAVVFTPPAPAVKPVKVEGISYRDNWSGEVTDFALLVKAVAAGDAPLTLLAINQTALNQMARAMKASLAIPGVKAVNKPVSPIRA